MKNKENKLQAIGNGVTYINQKSILYAGCDFGLHNGYYQDLEDLIKDAIKASFVCLGYWRARDTHKIDRKSLK